MIEKSEKIINRIVKAVGEVQSVLLIGEWEERLTTSLKDNNNIITKASDFNSQTLVDNSFTKVISDYTFTSQELDLNLFYRESRRLLLPTGMLIMAANNIDSLMDKVLRPFAKKERPLPKNTLLIKPKQLQDEIHDHGFSIEGYYGYPGNHILMMAEIQHKEVSTLFDSNDQTTILNEAVHVK